MDCRKEFLLPVQNLILKAIHFGVSICQVRSQPPQLIFGMLVFSEVVLGDLGKIFQRRLVHLKLLVGPFEAFFILGCILRGVSKIAAQALLSGSQARGQRFHLLLG